MINTIHIVTMPSDIAAAKMATAAATAAKTASAIMLLVVT
jgi:hypothetical protein